MLLNLDSDAQKLNYRYKFILSLLLIISVICVYWPVKGYDFVSFDDFQYVVENPHVKSGISWDGYAWSVSSIYMANWHPVTWLSHMLDVHLFGMNAGAHHMINLFIHILNSLLVFFLLDRLTNDSWKSIIVAALFALHPLHVESVAWISERKDLLCSFFWMIAIIFYCGYVKNKSIYQYFMALLSFMFGLLSKPMIITLPLTLLLLDFWPLRRVDFKGGLIKDGTFNFPQTHLGSLLLEKLPFFIFSATSGLVTIYSQKYGEITGSYHVFPLGLRIANALVSYIAYLVKTIWPANLSFFYPYPANISLLESFLAVSLLLAITVFAVKKANDAPFIIVGWFWYILTLLPVIGFVQIGMQALADRYSYIPLIGIFIMIVWGVPRIRMPGLDKKSVIIFLSIIALVLCSIKTRQQLKSWKNSYSLYTHALSLNQNNFLAHNNLGVFFFGRGNKEAARKHFQAAIDAKPNYADAFNNLGYVYHSEGDYAEAVKKYNHALAINKNHHRAKINLRTAKSYLNK